MYSTTPTGDTLKIKSEEDSDNLTGLDDPIKPEDTKSTLGL